MKETRPRKSLSYRFFRWIVLWVILPLVLFYVVVGIWHPEDAALRKAFAKVEQETGIRIEYSSINITPLGFLEFDDLKINQVKEKNWEINNNKITFKPQRLFSATKTTISVAWTVILSGKIGLSYNVQCYGGEAKGVIRAPILQPEAPLHILINWADLDFHKIGQDFPNLQLTQGTSSGNGELDLSPGQQFGETGFLNIEMANLSYRLPEKIAGVTSMSNIQRANGKLRFDHRVMFIEDLWARSDFGSLQVNGKIIRDLQPEKTMLDLNVRMYTHELDQEPKENEYIPITLKGTAASPQIEFLGMPLNMNKNPFLNIR